LLDVLVVIDLYKILLDVLIL